MERRNFIKTGTMAAAAFGFPTIMPASVFGQNAPSNRITVAANAFAALRAHAKGESPIAPKRYEIPTQLIVRRSTGIPSATVADLKVRYLF